MNTKLRTIRVEILAEERHCGSKCPGLNGMQCAHFGFADLSVDAERKGEGNYKFRLQACLQDPDPPSEVFRRYGLNRETSNAADIELAIIDVAKRMEIVSPGALLSECDFQIRELEGLRRWSQEREERQVVRQ